jgi:dolichol-phosphate mannosyltransferase
MAFHARALGAGRGARPARYTLVGVLGFIVQTAALWFLIRQAGLSTLAATLLATELAVLHNFAWHVRVTWADRPAGGTGTAARLLKFNVANGGISLAGAAVLMPLLTAVWGVHYLAANLITVLACSTVNYLAGDRWVFAGQHG